MNAWSRFAAVAMAGCLSALVAGTANGAEITVVAGGGPLPDVLGTLMPMFESATGNKVKISFKGGPELTSEVKQGVADLVITGTEQVDDLVKTGDVASDGKTLLMISKVGNRGESRGAEAGRQHARQAQGCAARSQDCRLQPGRQRPALPDGAPEARHHQLGQGQGRGRTGAAGRRGNSVRRSGDWRAAGRRATAGPWC